MSDTNVPQSTGGSGAGMSPMPDSGVPGGAPDSGGAGSFDPAALGQSTNANTMPEGTQYDMTGRMLNSAMLVAAANPQLDDDTCARLAVLAHRKVAANPLGYGDRTSHEGPIMKRVKDRVKDLVSGDFQEKQRARQHGHPQVRPGTQPGVRPGANPAPRPAPSTGEQLMSLLPLKPHERRLVDSIRGLVKKHRDRNAAPPMPSPHSPPIPAPPWVQDDEDDEQDDRTEAPDGPPAPGVLPPGAHPHDLNEPDSGSDEASGSKAAVRHQADNPLDFGNRAPAPEGPLEQKAVDEVNKAEDAIPMPGDTPKMPGGGGGGKPSGGGGAPGGAGAAGGEAAGAGELGEMAELAPMIAV